jgi:hypothetical protein
VDAPAVFAERIARWHDYYLLAGTAASTLMGLLFVSLSLHLEAVAEDGKAHLAIIAREAFASFLFVLFFSLLMLSPSIARRPLATSLLAIGVVRLAMIVPAIRHSLADLRRGAAFSRGYVLARSVIPILAYATLGLAGSMLLRGDPDDGLAALMLSIVLLLADAARSSWDLLVRVGRLARGARPK